MRSNTGKKQAFIIIAVIILLTSILIGVSFEFINEGNYIAVDPVSNNDYTVNDNFGNILIFVSFENDNYDLTGTEFEMIDRMYNSSNLSLKNYYKEQSFGKLNVNTSIFPQPEYNRYATVKVSKDKNYFRFKSNSNPDGYIDGSLDAILRETAMVFEIMRKFETQYGQQIGSGVGQIPFSALTLMICGSGGNTNDWGSILWPHQTSLNYLNNENLRATFAKNYINNSFTESDWKEVFDDDEYLRKNIIGTESGYIGEPLKIAGQYIKRYNLMEYNYLMNTSYQITDNSGHNLGDVGTVIHEFGHVLGFYDYYNYSNQNLPLMALWSTMESQAPVPVYIHGAAIAEYTDWFDAGNVVEIDKNGRYTLDSRSRNTSTEGNVFGYTITNPYSDPANPELYYIEFRTMDGDFENGKFKVASGGGYSDGSVLRAEGITITRVDRLNEKKFNGNAASLPNFPSTYGSEHIALPYDLDAYMNTTGLNAYQKESFLKRISVLTDLPIDARNGGTINGLTSYGNSDINSNENALMYYRSGKNGSVSKLHNSGILIENVTNNDDGTISFDVKFPQEEESEPIEITQSNINFADNQCNITFNLSVASELDLNKISIIDGNKNIEFDAILSLDKTKLTLRFIVTDSTVNIIIDDGALNGLYTKAKNIKYTQSLYNKNIIELNNGNITNNSASYIICNESINGVISLMKVYDYQYFEIDGNELKIKKIIPIEKTELKVRIKVVNDDIEYLRNIVFNVTPAVNEVIVVKTDLGIMYFCLIVGIPIIASILCFVAITLQSLKRKH